MAILTPTQANKLKSLGTSLSPNEDPTIMASAATIAPTYYETRVSGTVAIDTVTLPGTDFSGSIVLIPTAIWTLTTAGNVGLAATAVVGKAMTLTYNQGAGKWYPSYIA